VTPVHDGLMQWRQLTIASLTATASHGVRTVDNLRKYCEVTSETELEVGNSLLHSCMIHIFANRKKLHGSKRLS
jgi:hypothetical protein